MNFRDMTPERRLEVARAGGLKAHARGTARRWTTEEAIAASAKSAQVRAGRRAAAAEEVTERSAECYDLRCPATLAEFDVPLPFDGPEAA